MLYNLHNEFDVKQLRCRIEHLINKQQGVVEVIEKRPRSLNQNSYLHVLLSYLAARLGYDMEYVKVEYFKKAVNPEYFIIGEFTDPLTGTQHLNLRSSRNLSSEQLSTCIDRFRYWSQDYAGVYLPSSDEYNHQQDIRAQVDMEIEKAKRFI